MIHTIPPSHIYWISIDFFLQSDENKAESHKRSNPFTFKDTKKIAQEILDRKKEEMKVGGVSLGPHRSDSAGESSGPSTEESTDDDSEYEIEEIYQVCINAVNWLIKVDIV